MKLSEGVSLVKIRKMSSIRPALHLAVFRRYDDRNTTLEEIEV
jgi:hypothetical protein